MTGLPTLATGDVQLRWARPEVLDSARHRMLRLLTLAERLRYEATPRRETRDSFLLGRVLVRELAAETLGTDPLEIEVEARCADCGGPHGKPVLLGEASLLRVSIAHCDGAVVAALAVGREIGIDVERMRTIRERVAADPTIDPIRATRLQAVRKADGRRVPAESVRFRADSPEAWIDGSDTYYALTEPAVHQALLVSVALAR